MDFLQYQCHRVSGVHGVLAGCQSSVKCLSTNTRLSMGLVMYFFRLYEITTCIILVVYYIQGCCLELQFCFVFGSRECQVILVTHQLQSEIYIFYRSVLYSVHTIISYIVLVHKICVTNVYVNYSCVFQPFFGTHHESL